MKEKTYIPGRPFTMTDEDARGFMNAPRNSRLEKTLNPKPTTEYRMVGWHSSSDMRHSTRRRKMR